MNAYFNYLIEANVGLIMILAFHRIFLREETNFRLIRAFLLTGIFASLIFPFIHIADDQNTSMLSIGQVIPSYWLPEVVIGAGSVPEGASAAFNFWKYTSLLYIAGFVGFALIVSIQLRQLFLVINRSTTYRLRKLRIAESMEDKPTFSFFHFIFIGKADRLSSAEKQQIIRHESVHAQQWHSFDIMLVNALRIFFWFNPLINTYKKYLIQLHEFEADARAVENRDVNQYCSLLAKVALQSADFTLANHFNNSLTVKRIEMMRTIKYNIKKWKLVALTMVLPAVFLFVACQDQVMDDLTSITKNSTHALIVPAHIQQRFEQVQQQNPAKKYVLLELNEEASAKMKGLEENYGLPASVEVFKTTADGKPLETIQGASAAGVVLSEEKSQPASRQSRKELTYAIIEYNEQTNALTNASAEDKVFTVVEHQPEFEGGYNAMMDYLRANLRYPADARQKGIEGTVYTSFIVEKDGSVSEVKTIRGIHEEADTEARRVVQNFPKWVPGKQNGEPVRVRFVLPIKFNL